MYNALVVSSMMGCTISFTIPFALGVVSSLATSATAFGMMDRMDKKRRCYELRISYDIIRFVEIC